MDDVSGYGTADSCSDKTPPYLPTSRLQQQQPFEAIIRDEMRKDLSSVCQSAKENKLVSNNHQYFNAGSSSICLN